MLTQAKESILDDSDCVHALGSKELILLSILGSILGFRVFFIVSQLLLYYANYQDFSE